MNLSGLAQILVRTAAYTRPFLSSKLRTQYRPFPEIKCRSLRRHELIEVRSESHVLERLLYSLVRQSYEAIAYVGPQMRAIRLSLLFAMLPLVDACQTNPASPPAVSGIAAAEAILDWHCYIPPGVQFASATDQNCYLANRGCRSASSDNCRTVVQPLAVAAGIDLRCMIPHDVRFVADEDYFDTRYCYLLRRGCPAYNDLSRCFNIPPGRDCDREYNRCMSQQQDPSRCTRERISCYRP